MRYFKTQFQICLKHFLYAQPNYSNGANTHYLKVKPVNGFVAQRFERQSAPN